MKIICVGLGGFIGSCLRYTVNVYAPKLFGEGFTYSTLAVNAVGGLLIGFISDIALSRSLSPELRLLLITGILGGFTTFSAFSNETVQLFYTGRWMSGSMNIVLNVFLSLGGVVLGKHIARIFTGA